jgi:hypothetical protein
LRNIDTYRATHQRDDTLIGLRVQIIARRAEVKEEIRHLQAAIIVNEQIATQHQGAADSDWAAPTNNNGGAQNNNGWGVQNDHIQGVANKP